MLCFNSCIEQSKEKAFLAKYEFEDFSQFKNVSVFIRGRDSERNPIIFVDAPHLVRDTSKVGYYVVILDKRNYQIIKAKWMTKYDVESDTLKLQHLAQTFMQYKITRLKVDGQENVFVYLKDVETLALVRFANENELQKRSKEVKWINIKHNWYKPMLVVAITSYHSHYPPDHVWRLPLSCRATHSSRRKTSRVPCLMFSWHDGHLSP